MEEKRELQLASEFAEAYNAGTKQSMQYDYQGVPVFVVPNGMKIETLENLVEQQQERPYKLKQSVELLSAKSFIEYFNRFATEASTIFVDPEEAKFEAVIDYHDEEDQPRWKHHRATYACPKSKEWNSWTVRNNDKMSQEEFALFIEDNLKEIVEPNGAEMLEIAASLKASNQVDFRSAIRLDNGQVQFNYTEKVDGQAGVQGQLDIPEKIKIVVKPFLNGHPYEMEARFRYRINQGGLIMWYTLIRPHAVQKDAVDQVIAEVTEGMQRGQILEAKAPR